VSFKIKLRKKINKKKLKTKLIASFRKKSLLHNKQQKKTLEENMPNYL